MNCKIKLRRKKIDRKRNDGIKDEGKKYERGGE